ncbi:dihydropteroate synthase [Lactiplantibacillus plantarum]|uniref:dihydropteroate synthase n=1 Tax=Lactiplantibacillus plantarum TaxID=1590 RepID=UPI0002BE0292|nr:dihydropteroate synthase [Lactiplantibacillus plantarum]AGL65435.2 Dihydropteroate synthase [Lactiplantibacillus plantarum subsp. plantarum P-8]AGO09253.1 dihydropteroate synthase [Lactiplantibacillus plantarum 16]APB86658.1 dihydropteroate synthase [Lactiplantibacillus plantarum]APP12397.1 dihydropteroate synthase [Lactiplantibacillus plantarum subsp. plantarum]AQY71256.1 dihydropteroate synthase [Lactiplantibacillus plantarum]
MLVQDITSSLAQATDFASQALNAQVQRQQQLVLRFSDYNREQQLRLTQLCQQLDGVVLASPEQLTVLLNQTAGRQLTHQWSRVFTDQATTQIQLTQIMKQYDVFWQTGEHRFNLTKKPMIYGIMNITPDSFFDGGQYKTKDDVLNHVDAMLQAGADVIEVNGQTTRPGFTEVTPQVELDRTLPYIRAIKARFPEAVLAVDTYKYDVMQAVLEEGVSIINDVNAFTDDPRKLKLMADSRVGLLTMHSSRDQEYTDLTSSMRGFFEQNLAALTSHGIDIERIALDQGIGYSQVAHGEQDYVMMRNIDEFNYLRRPMMVAISRKGYLGLLLGLKKEDRLPMTLVTEAAMMLKGGRIIRVHDVAETKQLITLLGRIENGYWLSNND